MQNNKFYNIYILYGENTHLKQKKINAIKQNVLENNINEFNYNVLYAEDSSIRQVIDLANTFPIITQNRLIILKNFDKFASKEKQLLNEYIANPSSFTCLIIEDKNNPDKKESIYKTFIENKLTCYVETCWQYKQNELIQIIIDCFKENKKIIEYDAAVVLAELIENNPSSLIEEIKKLQNFSIDKEKISLSDIKSNILKSQNHNIYELASKVTNNEIENSIRFLNNLSPKEIKAPQLLLFVLTDRFTKILKYTNLLNEGMDPKLAQKSLGIMSFLDPNFHKHALNFKSISKLNKIFDLLINADFILKTTNQNPLFIIENLIIQILQIK